MWGILNERGCLVEINVEKLIRELAELRVCVQEGIRDPEMVQYGYSRVEDEIIRISKDILALKKG